jgi:hypothetical protein
LSVLSDRSLEENAYLFGSKVTFYCVGGGLFIYYTLVSALFVSNHPSLLNHLALLVQVLSYVSTGSQVIGNWPYLYWGIICLV